MILRLTIHPTGQLEREHFVWHSTVAQSVRITYDFRSYDKLNSLGSLLRDMLWREFAIGKNGASLEIVRSFETNNFKYMESEEEYNLLWEYCGTLLSKHEAEQLKNAGGF